MIYTITYLGSESLDAPLYSFKDTHGSTALALFTTEDAAREFAKGERGDADLAVAELRDPALVGLLADMRAQDINTVIVDPPPRDDALLFRTTSVNSLITAASVAILDGIRQAEVREEYGFRAVDVVCCSHCGRVLRVAPGDTLPMCCGATMRFAARDSERAMTSE